MADFTATAHAWDETATVSGEQSGAYAFARTPAVSKEAAVLYDPPGGIIAQVTTYVMVGRDVDCGGVVYRTWQVTGTPDFVGTQYTGARCGVTPFANVTIAAKFT